MGEPACRDWDGVDPAGRVLLVMVALEGVPCMRVQSLLLSRDDRKANHCKEVHTQQRSSYESGWHDKTCHPRQLAMKASVHVSASMLRRGIASAPRWTYQCRSTGTRGLPKRLSEDPLGLRAPVLRIHQIHMFLGLLDPDPDPSVRGMDPDPDPALDQDPSIIK
jgi:hypothetical protein